MFCDSNALYDNQFGFRSRHSIQQALITLVDRITKSQDMSNIAISKCITSKWHSTLSITGYFLRRLYAYASDV